MSKINKPNLKFNGNLTPLRVSNIQGTVIHHLAHPSWGLMDTHRYHRDRLGWSGIGYNYLILRSGTIYEGRGDHVGAHASGNNSTHLGIALTGDFERGSQRPTKDQMDSLVWLIKELKKKYKNADKVKGHYDVGSTSCPGRRFPLQDVKDRLINRPQTFRQRHGDVWGKDGYEALQEGLNELGYDVGKVDGIFGQKTLDGTRQFQLDQEVSVEGAPNFGRPGPQTMNALQAALKKKERGAVYRVIVDSKQIGAYSDVENIVKRTQESIEDGKKNVKLERV